MNPLNALFFVLLTSLLIACHSSAPLKKTYVVHRETLHKMLYFTGTLQPLKENAITTPMEGVLETIPIAFGQSVKQGEVVFTVRSPELQKQYNETLTDYLKAKDNYTVAKAKFSGTDDLWQAGLISKNNYVSEQSSLNTTRVSLMQAKRKLAEMREKTGDPTLQSVSKLSFTEFHKVRLALSGKHDLIHLKAPSTGVLLYPPIANEDKTGHLTPGATIKAGQVLAQIGDLSGIRVDIDVPEVDLDKIKLNMPATIHGIAFSKQALTGKLVTIHAQATPGKGGALPSFTAVVEVTRLTTAQQQHIKVGMSAAIELATDSINKLLVPIAAVSQSHGQSIVYIIDDKKHLTPRQVFTGAAHDDKVVIESGLTAGDVLTYD